LQEITSSFSEIVAYHLHMRSSDWTPEEREREERAREIRARHSRKQSPEERLAETLRFSRFISELREGVPSDPETERITTDETLDMCGSGWDGDLDEQRAGWRVI
jgi:hypothetical protein